MKTIKEKNEQNIKVPVDMLIDVLGLIVKESLKHEIIQVEESKGLVIIALKCDPANGRHEKVFQNIKSMLDEYNEFRFSENEEDWRD